MLATKELLNHHGSDQTMIIPVEGCMLILKFEGSDLAVSSLAFFCFPHLTFTLPWASVFLNGPLFSPSSPREQTRHADNGVSMERVALLLDEGHCRCERGSCFTRYKDSRKDLSKFLDAFWSLEKPAQDAYVRFLAHQTC